MSWTNYHSHCTFCDGREHMEEFIKYAIAKRVAKYGFSSHAPIPFETHWTMKTDDYDDYVSEFERLKHKYSDKIELFLGLEIDYIVGCTNALMPFFKDKILDYKIGSIHYLDKLKDGTYCSIDGLFKDFYKGMKELYDNDIINVTKRYFELSKCMVETGGIDIVGHLDKITLHGARFADFDINASWYVDLFVDYLQLIKQKKLIVEINTKSLLEKGMTFPDKRFFPLINEMQIPITVNSDCHYPSKVIDGFAETYSELKRAGFTETYQLIDSDWQPVKF